MSHINSYGRPGHDGAPRPYHDPRRNPSTNYQTRGPPGSPGNVQDHYNYNSDPNSESSSFGSNNTPNNDYDVQFGDTPLQLGFSNQLDGQYSNGSGQNGGMSPNGNTYGHNNGYMSPGVDQSRNPYRNGSMSPGNPYRGYANGGMDGMNGNSPTSPGGSNSPKSPGGVQRKSIPPPAQPPVPPVQSAPPPAPVISTPEPKKKRGLLKRLSKS